MCIARIIMAISTCRCSAGKGSFSHNPVSHRRLLTFRLTLCCKEKSGRENLSLGLKFLRLYHSKLRKRKFFPQACFFNSSQIVLFHIVHLPSLGATSEKPASLFGTCSQIYYAMKVHISLAIRMYLAASLAFFDSVSALPGLVARQSSCDSIVCPSDWLDGLGGFFNQLLDQSAQSPPGLLPPVPLPPQDDRLDPLPAGNRQDLQTLPGLDKIPQEDPQHRQVPNTPPTAQSDNEILIEVSPWPGNQCQATTSQSSDNTGNAVRP